jgi:glycyl-tRNA synthetase beta chain
VAGLTEWPVPMLGAIDAQFMDVPPEVLIVSMKVHLRFFTTAKAGGALANRFVVVANNVARDGGKTIVAGNERVLRGRLADAKFFWDQDRKQRLEDRVPALEQVVFHAKLGTQAERVERIVKLAGEIATSVPGANADDVATAARLCKADLVSGMVGEFPELQGVMGRYYALGEKLPAAVADAIGDHYAPAGPNDRCPSAPESIAVALADKLDALVSFWSIGEKPTGSRDPFALRRAALGVIRIVVENKLRLPLRPFVTADDLTRLFRRTPQGADAREGRASRHRRCCPGAGQRGRSGPAAGACRSAAILLRYRRRQEPAHTATAARPTSFAPKRRRTRGSRRRSPVRQMPPCWNKRKRKPLLPLWPKSSASSGPPLAAEDFAGAMKAFAGLRAPIDALFDKVTVNVTDKPELRLNRLKLLNQIRATMDTVADFSKIEG